MKHLSNPFGLRLNKTNDIFPSKKLFEHTKLTFTEYNYNQMYDYCLDFSEIKLSPFSSNIDFTGEVRAYHEILNLDKYEFEVDKFLANFSGLEFPVFPLNFDYMRVLASVVQEKVEKYVDCFEEIIKIFEGLDTQENEINSYIIQKNKKTLNTNNNYNTNSSRLTNNNSKTNSKFNYYNHKRNEIKGKSKEKYNLNNNTQSSNTQTLKSDRNLNTNNNYSYNNNNQNDNNNFNYNESVYQRSGMETPMFTSSPYNDNAFNTNTNQIQAKYINPEVFENFYNSLLNPIKSFIFKEFINCLYLKEKNKSYLTFTKRVFQITLDRKIKDYYSVFLINLMITSKKSMIFENHMSKKQEELKRKAFSIIKVVLRKKILINKQIKSKYKSKGFYGLVKIYYEEKFQREKTTNARVFYFKNLIRKFFQMLCYHRFLCKENIELSGSGINDYKEYKQRQLNVKKEKIKDYDKLSEFNNENEEEEENDYYTYTLNNIKNIEKPTEKYNNSNLTTESNKRNTQSSNNNNQKSLNPFSNNLEGGAKNRYSTNQNNNYNQSYQQSNYNENTETSKNKSKNYNFITNLDVNSELNNLLGKLNTQIKLNSQNKIKTKNSLVNNVMSTNHSGIQTTVNLNTNSSINNDHSHFGGVSNQITPVNKFHSSSPFFSTKTNNSRYSTNQNQNYGNHSKLTGGRESDKSVSIVGHPNFLKKTKSQVVREFV